MSFATNVTSIHGLCLPWPVITFPSTLVGNGQLPSARFTC